MLFALLAVPALAQSPTLVGSTSNSSGGSNTSSITLSLPGGMQAEDLIIVSVSWRRNVTITPTDDGWIEIVRTNEGNNVTQALFYRVYRSGDPATYQFNSSANARNAGTIVVYRNANPASVELIFSANNGSSNAATALSVDTETDNSVILGFYAARRRNSLTTPAGMTQLQNLSTSGGINNNLNVMAAAESRATAGNTGNRNASVSESRPWVAHMVSVAPRNSGNTIYSYQSGNWSDANIWTTDPSGTTLTGSVSPSRFDSLVVLNGRTLTLTANLPTNGYRINVEAGGFLDFANFTAGRLTTLNGGGTVRTRFVVTGSPNTAYFPATFYNYFTAETGGTVAYYQQGSVTLPTDIPTYRNLILRNETASNYTFTQAADLEVFNDLSLQHSGAGTLTFQTGNNTTARSTTVGNNVTISAQSTWQTIAADVNNSITIGGDLVNNGSFLMSRMSGPNYLSDSNQGRAEVRFTGAQNNKIDAFGSTIFYRMIVDKGIDQTNVLTVNSTNTANFRLFGRNNQSIGAGDNPTSDKALFIQNGTLRLTSNIEIESLTEGGNDYFINGNASLWIDGATVFATLTAGSPGGSSATGNTGLTVIGNLRVSAGTLNTRDSAGVIYRSDAEIVVEGGTLRTSTLRTTGFAGVHRAAFVITGGTIISDGEGESGGAGRFSLPFADNSITMSGGEVIVTQPSGVGGTTIDFRMDPINYNITGGSWQFIATNGSTNFTVDSTAPFYNVTTIKTGGGSADVRLNAPLTVLNNLTVQSGVFQATSNHAVSVGGNFTLASGATYDPNSNTTTFNGSGQQLLTLDGSISDGGLFNTTIDKSADTLRVAGAAGSLVVRNDLTFTSGTLDDGGKTVEVNGALAMSGVHLGTGKMQLNPNGNRTITGNGSGRFGNLELTSTATNVTFATAANLQVDGTLTFTGTGTQQRILDIAGNLLTLSGGAAITGATADRYIRTNGTASAGGVTKIFDNELTFTWPVGAGTKYTPAVFALDVNPTTFGSVNIKPVDASIPAITDNTYALNYYWKATDSGFDLGAAKVSFTFEYLSADLGANVTPAELVPGRYDLSTNTWAVNTPASVDQTNRIITFDGVLYEGAITGDYSTADINVINPFGSLDIYYSCADSDWFTLSTWCLDSHTGSTIASSVPGANTIAVVGNGNTVTINSDDALSAILRVLDGSTLDIAATNGHTLGVVDGPTYGTLRIGASYFPGGDFGDFLNNGTVVYYRTGSNYTIPVSSVDIATIDTYFNLQTEVNTGGAGSFITLPNLDLTVLNDVTVSGTDLNRQTRVGDGASASLTVNGNLSVNSGSLRYRFNGSNNREVTIFGNTTIASGAQIGFYDNSANRVHFLNLHGSLVNNGTLALNNSTARTIELTFLGTANAEYSGTGTNTFSRLEVDKGSSQSPRLLFSNSGSITAPSGALALTNGTFEITRGGILTLTNTATTFTIPSTAALVVNNATADVRIGYTNNNAADLILRGRLELADGTVRVGNPANNNNNDIEYASAGTPEIVVSGGLLDVNGQIRRSTLNVSGSLVYRQTGGEVRIRGRAATTTRGMLEITNAGSEFEMSGTSLLHLYRGGSVTYADFYVRPASNNVTGGTVLFRPTGAGNQSYLLDVTTNLWNVTVQNDGANAATLTQQINNLEIGNNLLLDDGSTYNANGLNLFIGGRLTRAGAASFNAGANTVTFNGSAGEISGSLTGTNAFNNLVVASSGVLTQLASSPIQINGSLTVHTGASLGDGDNRIDLRGNVTNSGTHSSPGNSSVAGIDLNGSGTQQIAGNGTFGNVILTNTGTVNLTGNIEITNRLTLTGTSLLMNDRQVTFGTGAEVTGYNATRYLRSNGVLSDGGVRKRYATGAASFEFPIGVFGKYTPVTIDVTANTATGTVTIKPVNVKHPSHRDAGTNLLQYYWNVSTTGFAGLSVNHTYSYVQGDVSGTESLYRGGRYLFPNWTPLGGIPGAVNTTANTITLSGVDYISGDYTAGDQNEFTTVSTFYSRDTVCDVPGGCNWNDPNSWSTVSHGGAAATNFPNGEPVVIATGHTVLTNGNTRLAESLELTGTAVLDLEDSFAHNFGVVSGTGTIRIKATAGNQFVFPGGNYSAFSQPSTGGTVEFYDNINGTLPTQTQYNDVIMTGTSTRTQANVDWTINGSITLSDGVVDNTVNNRNVSLSGDWLNNASATAFDPGTGKLILTGSAAQSLGGSFGTTFGFIELDGPGDKSLDQPAEVRSGMIFNRGNLFLNDQNMTWGDAATVGGTPADTSMIVVNGTGVLRRLITSTGSYHFPVGDTTGTPEYSPSTITFDTGAFASGAWVQMGVTNQADPECGGGNYITRYWTVEMNGVSSFSGTGTFRYTDGDIVGDENDIKTLSRDISSTNCLVGSAANTSTNTLTLSLTSTGFIITGGDKGALLPPGVQPSDLTFVNVTATTIELEWTNGDGTGRIVLVREDTAVDADPQLNTFYTADANFGGSPDEIGTGNLVAYEGAGNTFTLSGLNPKTRYHLSLFEYNDDGSFITYLTTSPLVGDTLTMARFEITFTQDTGWRMVALPLTNTAYNQVFANAATTGLYTQGFPYSTYPTASPNLLWYDETVSGTDNQRWRQPSDIADQAVAGRGYMYYAFGDQTPGDTRYDVGFPLNISVDGYEPALTGDFDFTLTYTAAGDEGWNLLGNPYDDNLDWDSPEWSRTAVSNAIYIWDPNASGGPKYRVWSNSVGDDMDGIIARGQAFWVKATGANPALSVNRNAIVAGGTFYGKNVADGGIAGDQGPSGTGVPVDYSASGSGASINAATGTPTAAPHPSVAGATHADMDELRAQRRAEAPPHIEIRVENNGLYQSAWLMFDENARKGVDDLDAWHLTPLTDTYVSVSTRIDEEDFTINALPRRFNSIMEIPVHVGAFENGVSTDGNFVLSVGELGNIPREWAIELVDTRTSRRVFWKRAHEEVWIRADESAATLLPVGWSRDDRTAPFDEFSGGSDNRAADRASFDVPSGQRDTDTVTGSSGTAGSSTTTGSSPYTGRQGGSDGTGLRRTLPETGAAAIDWSELGENDWPFSLIYEEPVRIQMPRPGEVIRMKSLTGSSQSRFVIRINPNGEFEDLPSEITLWQNFPNPFNPTTTIRFGLPQEERVQIDVFDVLGRRVTTLAGGDFPAGIHTVQFDARRYASGVYFVRMVAGGVVHSRKMTLIK
ncbi:MAG: extracellular S8 family protease [Bacteroidetes bacterium HLUCCA01]|nr:MAG: extracellular S8 family protease [Bacteroidetes bacterium HLUCCA01]